MHILDEYGRACDSIRLKINADKSKWMVGRKRERASIEMKVNGERWEEVEEDMQEVIHRLYELVKI